MPFPKSKPGATKSPIKANPLRDPGQSLKEQIDDYLFDKIFPWILFPVFATLIFGLELFHWLISSTTRTPWHYLAVVLILIPLSLWQIFRHRRVLRQLHQGLSGERAVGQFLDETLRPLGYHVLHDLPQKDADGTTFNIDHIAIGPAGILTIETKTRSKPAIGQPLIHYQGDTVSVDGGPKDPAPIRQARAAAERVRALLAEQTGRQNIHVQPVLAYPGWFIEGTSTGRAVWVLEPKALPAWVARDRETLSREDIALYTSRLKGLVRQMPH